MQIRKTKPSDMNRLLELYEGARKFMKETGNPKQWAARNWPPKDLIKADIDKGLSYVCEKDGQVVGVFFYEFGQDVEPTYRDISQGSWSTDQPYGVIHRIAADTSVKGVGSFCIQWALNQAGHMRIDTHADNQVMRNLLAKLGFEARGIIYVVEDDDPRIAFEAFK